MIDFLKRLFGGRSTPHRLPVDTSRGGVYTQLRARAISISRSAADLPAPDADAPIWGILMEFGLAKGAATLFTLTDGTSSLYLSSGGGVIGGQGHESVRQASAEFLVVANQFKAGLRPSTEQPLPTVGETRFHALTDAGVLSGGAADAELGSGRHELSPMFAAGHGLLTQLRLCSGG